MRFRAFPEQVCPRIVSLERVDNFGTSEHFSGREKKKSNLSYWSGVLNFYCMQMSLVMSMRFIFGND